MPKLTSQNQVFKPTNNLLAWDDKEVGTKPNQRNMREGRFKLIFNKIILEKRDKRDK